MVEKPVAFEGEISMALSGLCGKVVNTKLTYYNKSTLYITSYLQIDCLFVFFVFFAIQQ